MSQKCSLCGRRRGRRACPALGESICAACCGTKRLVEISCPPECSYLRSSQAHPPAAVQRQRERDLQLRTTTSGPHRDDVRFTLERARFAAQGSTGQKRLASLVLRVAQAEFFQRTTGRRPILLLDDVLLELDAAKRERFLRRLPAYDQAFFTFLPDEPYQRYGGARTMLLAVSAGTFEPCIEPPTC